MFQGLHSTANALETPTPTFDLDPLQKNQLVLTIISSKSIWNVSGFTIDNKCFRTPHPPPLLLTDFKRTQPVLTIISSKSNWNVSGLALDSKCFGKQRQRRDRRPGGPSQRYDGHRLPGRVSPLSSKQILQAKRGNG